ncbi:MAG TPA: helix-turn-helix transcriptional regulator [Chloroflexota bacterium]|nr:helix-turn-helix transcriptional regulator [Chloroflexota bacterium]
MKASASLQAGFGRALREKRGAAAFSQEELAHRAKLHPTYISQLERGLKSPSLAAIESLARALDLRPDELVKAAQDNASRSR